jgi:uncharacterized membrane protein YbhN (UPF0104 family)
MARWPASRGRVLIQVAGASTVGVLIAIAVGVGAIRLLTDVDPVPVLLQLKPSFLLASVLAFVLGNLLCGHRFLALLPTKITRRPGPWAAGSLFFGASVFSLLLPGPVGELAAAAGLSRRYGIDGASALATAVHARFVGLASAAVLALVVLPFVVVDTGLGQVLWLSAVVIGLGGAGLGVISARPGWLSWLGIKLTAPATGVWGWLLSKIRVFARALSHVGQASLRTWLIVFLWSVLMQLVQMLALILVATALDLSPALPGVALAQGTGSLAILVGIFMPGGLGTFELAFVSSMVGPGMLDVAAAGVLVVGMRVVHLLGLAVAGLMFAAWARLLLSSDVVDSIEELRGS